MKNFKLCSVIGLSTVLLFGCGSSDDDDTIIDPIDPEPPVVVIPVEPPVEPPVVVIPEEPPVVVTTVNIDETATLTAAVQSANPEGGTVIVKLTGDDAKSVTDATAFNVIIMGYPEAGESTTKYKLAWHQASHANCIESEACTMDINESESGLYHLTFDNIEWQEGVENYRIALEVKGDKAHHELVFMD